MIDWDDLAPETRLWTQTYLASLNRGFPRAYVLGSRGRDITICGTAQREIPDQPCGDCIYADRCLVASWIRSGFGDAQQPAHLASRDGDHRLPPFYLAYLSVERPPSTQPDMETAANFVRQTWLTLAESAEREDEVRRILGAAENLAKLAAGAPTPGQMREELNRQLRTKIPGLVAWAVILRDELGRSETVPDTPGVPAKEVIAIQEALVALPMMQREGYVVLSRSSDDTSLFTKLRRLLCAAGPAEPREGCRIAAIRLLQEPQPAGDDLSRLWMMCVAFDVGPHEDGPTIPETGVFPTPGPGTPMFTRIRLLGQLALAFEDNARRFAESRVQVESARRTREVPGKASKGELFAGLVGDSRAMQKLCGEILRVARSDRTVLLVGESGTGKEAVARLIHRYSDRVRFEFLCSAVADEFGAGARMWRSFHPDKPKIADAVMEEYRHVPLLDLMPGSLDGDATWMPPEIPLKEALRQAEGSVPDHWRAVYRALMRKVYIIWGENPDFNLLEYDSGNLTQANFDSELFGVVSGAYTGVVGKPGQLQIASHCGGTLFLDNLHRLDTSVVQGGLLKVTEVTHEARRIMRKGSANPEPARLRIIAASIDDVPQLAEKGFADELLQRLTSEIIRIPPLRDRMEDVPGLAVHFARQCNTSIDDDAIAALMTTEWRAGNVRELENVIKSAATRLTNAGEEIGRTQVEEAMGGRDMERSKRPLTGEEQLVRDALHAVGSVRQAARRIGWSRQKLYRKMREYGIDLPSGKGRGAAD